MPRKHPWPCGLLACALIVLTGCQRVNFEKTATVEPHAVQKYTLDAPRSDQQVTVTISSPGVPVSAYLISEADAVTTENCILNNKTPPKVFDSKEEAEEFTLNATIPAGTEYALMLTSAKEAVVKVKLTGK
jgi:hypothetical protein